MDLRSYTKIYNLGHKALTDLFTDPVLIEEKIDGSQFSFGLIEGVLHCCSKRADIVIDGPSGMFDKGVETAKRLHSEGLLKEGWVYRGEFLNKPKHNSLAYGRVPEGNIILWDVDAGDQHYLTRAEKEEEARRIGLEIVPVFFSGTVESVEQLQELLETTSCLGGQKIEGYVIKNYHRYNVDGKTLMGKYVSERFRELNKKDFKDRNPGQGDIVLAVIDKYRCEARWDKAVQHLKEEGKLEHDPRDIGPLMKEVHRDILEECKDDIAEMVFKWTWKKAARGMTAGLPEWYKERMMKESFEPAE